MLVTNESNNTNCATAGVFLIASLAGTYDDHGLVITPPATVAADGALLDVLPPGRQAR